MYVQVLWMHDLLRMLQVLAALLLLLLLFYRLLARWDGKDVQAHALIALSVKRNITPHIRSAKTAK